MELQFLETKIFIWNQIKKYFKRDSKNEQKYNIYTDTIAQIIEIRTKQRCTLTRF